MGRYKKVKHETTSPAEKAFKVLSIVLVIFAFAMVSAYGVVLWFIEPPEVSDQPRRGSGQTLDLSQGPQEEEEGLLLTLPEGEVGENGRRRNVFSILIAGEDDGFGGPDVIMVALLDQSAGTLDVLSIPRDTMVNVPWGLKKINSYQHLHHLLPQRFDHYIYALQDGVSKLIGYHTDFWVTLDLPGFTRLVDAIGGVEFNVPQRMFYSDPEQDLLINLEAGQQRLNGNQAMQLVRFRNYPDGDIGRIRVQHSFLSATANQLLSPSNIFAANDLVNIFTDHVDTDLSVRNMAFFAYELLRLEPQNIRFHTVDANLANINDSVNGISYVSLFVEPWVALINRYMNPFIDPIRAQDLEILTRDPRTGNLFTTNGAPIVNNWVR